MSSVTISWFLRATGALVTGDQLGAFGVEADTSVQLVAFAGQLSWTRPGASVAGWESMNTAPPVSLSSARTALCPG